MDADFLLLHRMRNGDDQAIEDFVRKYYPMILRYCQLHIADRNCRNAICRQIPMPEQPLHKIVLGRTAAVFHSTVFFNDLVDLIPYLIDLLHIGLAHRHIGRSDGVAGGGMLCQEAIFRNAFLTLNPTADTHGVLFDELVVY